MNAASSLDRDHAISRNTLPLVDCGAADAERLRKSDNASSTFNSSRYCGVIGKHAQSLDHLNAICQDGLNLFSQGRLYTPGMADIPARYLDDATRTAIGRRFRLEAIRIGVSQAQLARDTGRTRQATNHWFKGRNFLGFEEFYLLCDKYKLSADYIMFGREAESPAVVALAQRIAKMPPEARNALNEVFNNAAVR